MLKNISSLPSILDIPEEDVITYEETIAPNYLAKDFYISNTFEPAVTRDTRIHFFTESHYEVYKLVSDAVMDKIEYKRITVSPEIQGIQKIYLSRRNLPRRHLENEDVLFDELSKRGYVKIQLEKYTVAENIYLIKTCDCIVSEHGSALSNLFFAVRKNLKVACFGHPHESINILWSYSAKRYGFEFYEDNTLGHICMERFDHYLPDYQHLEEEDMIKIAPWKIDVSKAIEFLNQRGM
jgi:capsular polysaccharide biosynthesis protein